MSTVADESGRDGGWFDKHQKGAWIAAGAAIVAALIGLVPALVSSGDDKTGGATAVPTPPTALPTTAPTSGPATTSAPSRPRSSAPSPSATPAGSQLWQGVLLLSTEAKDLDAVPPEPVGYSDAGDVYMLYENEMSGWNGTLIAQWSGASGALPGYQDCAGVVGAQGSRDKVKLTKTTVLCVRTSDQNIARLKVSALGAGGALDSRATFDVVIWNAI